MKKIASGSTFLALALLLAACTTNGTSTQGNLGDGSQSSVMTDMSSSSDAGVTLTISSASSAAAQSSASQQATTGKTNVIAVNVQNFAFVPNVIHAKKGQKTQIKLTGVSGNHGFAIPAMGINVRVSTGDTVVVDLPTDVAGTFDAMCSVPCGPGHREMTATVVID